MAQTTWHVNGGDGNDQDTGLSWQQAFATIDHAITVASTADKIKVAQGTYTPGTTASDSFLIPDGVILEGGYAGNDNDPDPDPAQYPTILDGQGDREVVLTCVDTDVGTHIQGFTIRNAVLHGIVVQAQSSVTRPTFESVIVYSNGRPNAEISDSGGGLHISRSGILIALPELRRCTFSENVAIGGGGVFIGTGCTIRATDCVFTNNRAMTPVVHVGEEEEPICISGIGGGAVWNVSFAANPLPQFRNCLFQSNEATWEDDDKCEGGNGGAVLNNGNLRLLACQFVANAAYGGTSECDTSHGGNGGAVFSGNWPAPATTGNVTINACIFRKNHALYPVPLGAGVSPGGGGLYSVNETLQSTNCVYKLNDIFGSQGVGAGIVCFESDHTVYNATLTQNYADDYGGLYIKNVNTQAAYANSIFWQNTNENTPPDASWNVYDATTNTTADVVITYSDIGDDVAGVNVPFGGAANHNMDVDPLFLNPTEHQEFGLSDASPCIDAGNTPVVPQDADDLNDDLVTTCGGCGISGERMPDVHLRRRVRRGPPDASTDGVPEAGCAVACGCTVDMGAVEHTRLPVECLALGDMNGDGLVDGDDIQPFYECLLGGSPASPCRCADMNIDGLLTIDDLYCFVQTLLYEISACHGIEECNTADCNTNLVSDLIDIISGDSQDADSNGIPDECEGESFGGGEQMMFGGGEGEGGAVMAAADCNENGIDDSDDLWSGGSGDCNTNGRPDECEFGSNVYCTDVNTNLVPDICDIAAGILIDADQNHIADDVESRALTAPLARREAWNALLAWWRTWDRDGLAAWQASYEMRRMRVELGIDR